MKPYGMPIAMAALLMAAAASPLMAAQVGKPAPDFTLTDTTGQTHSLSDFKGKIVVLEWFNPDCPFVKKHYDAQNMQALQKKYTSKGVVWLSICSSAPGKQGHYAPEKMAEIMKSKSAGSTAVLLDPSGKTGKAYGAKTTPHMYVVDAQGNLVYNGAIDSIRSTRPADTADAENYVAAALDSLMNGKPVQKASTKPYGCSVKY